MYLPPMVFGVLFAGFAFVARTLIRETKNEHEFVPIFDENGKRVGFTHPVLVEATEKIREHRERAEAASAAKKA